MQFARDIMSTTVITARPDMTCEEVQQLLAINRISGLPVVDQAGVLVGVISMTDLLKRSLNLPFTDNVWEARRLDRLLANEGMHLEAELDGFILDFMTRDVIYAYPETRISRLATIMQKQQIHRIMIVEPHTHKLTGIVTTFDLLRMLAVPSLTRTAS